MKTILILLLAGSCGLLSAQINSSVQGSPERDIGLHSGQFYYDGKSRQLVYYDNVTVTNWEGKLSCERLAILLPPEGSADNHPTSIVAETNVVIDLLKNNDTNHITSDKAIYAYSVLNAVTNETITFTGHARGEDSRGWMTGEPLVWDNVANRFSGTDFKTIIKPSPNSGDGANPPPAGTNNLTAPKPKLPPGTIENIDGNIPLNSVPARGGRGF